MWTCQQKDFKKIIESVYWPAKIILLFFKDRSSLQLITMVINKKKVAVNSR